MTEKWIVDDAGTLINMSTRNHYDYMEEVVDVLNKLSEENEKLKQELFESKKDYLIETYSDNLTRRDEKIQGLKEEFKEKFGDSE